MTIFFLAAKMQNSTMGKWENRKMGKSDGWEMESRRAGKV